MALSQAGVNSVVKHIVKQETESSSAGVLMALVGTWTTIQLASAVISTCGIFLFVKGEFLAYRERRWLGGDLGSVLAPAAGFVVAGN